MQGIIMFIIILIILFILTREFWCWYWKINIKIEQIEKVNENLEQIKALLIYENTIQSNSKIQEDEKLPEL